METAPSSDRFRRGAPALLRRMADAIERGELPRADDVGETFRLCAKLQDSSAAGLTGDDLRNHILVLIWVRHYWLDCAGRYTSGARQIERRWREFAKEAAADPGHEPLPDTEADLYARLGRHGFRPLMWRRIAQIIDEPEQRTATPCNNAAASGRRDYSAPD